MEMNKLPFVGVNRNLHMEYFVVGKVVARNPGECG
jgi:hypothetical protein